jgi:hypothetical protein
VRQAWTYGRFVELVAKLISESAAKAERTSVVAFLRASRF